MILNSPYISGSLTVTGNEVVTGSLTVLGGITGAITGSATSASYAANTSLLNNKDSGEFVATGSFNTYTASNDATVTSVAAAAVSAVAGVNALAARTGSYTTTSSFNSYTASNNTTMSCVSSTATSALAGVGALASQTGSYATTGSNTFVGGQYLSSSFNPTGFSTTASLYTDGGLRVTRDAYISGTLYLNNVTVFGTQSVAYISSSQLNIGTNLITVNTDTPSIRFGGLAVYDSGSTGLTGSILWDSQNNHWVYTNPSGSCYSGGMFISGPRTSELGSEVGTTSCALMMGQGGDHITSSAVFHYGNATCFYGTSFISSSGAACFAGSLTGTNANFSSTLSATNLTAEGSPALGGVVSIRQDATYLAKGNGYSSIASSPSAFDFYGYTGASTYKNFTFRFDGLTDNTRRDYTLPDACGTIALLNGTQNFTGTVCAPSFISSGTICSTGNTCFGGMSVVASCLGIGTVAPTERLEVRGSCGCNIARFTDGNNGDLIISFPSYGVSSIDSYLGIGHGALAFRTCTTERMRFTAAGIACFACRVCSPALTTPNIRLSDETTFGATWCKGAGGYPFMFADGGQSLGFGNSEAASPTSERFRIFQTGVACFACQVCTPYVSTNTIELGGTAISPTAACVGYGMFGYSGVGLGIAAGANGPNQGISFFTCGVERGRWITSGNLGVGTVCPGARLQIRASASAGATDALYVENSSSTGLLQVRDDGLIYMKGCVGINETSPSSMLHFSKQTTWGTTDNRIINISNTGTGGNINIAHNMGSITWYSGNSTPTAEIAAYRNTPASGNNIELRFYTATAGTVVERLRITSTGAVLPGANGTQDLGSSDCRWCTVYTSDLSLNNGIGNYTIVEGENDLFLYNNNSCKVYKFIVQEVCPEIAPAKRSI